MAKGRITPGRKGSVMVLLRIPLIGIDIRRDTALLAGIAIAYIWVQLAIFYPERFLEYDEAVYLSQVALDRPAIYFGPHRARGVTLLVAPLVFITDSVIHLRWWLASISGICLFAGFYPWTRILAGVPVAAVLFGMSWLGLFYGVETSPNLFAAFAALAAVGWYAVSSERPEDTRPLVWCGLALALLAVTRPSDSIWVALGLGLSSIAFNRHMLWRHGVTIALGVGLGWVPWLLEAYFRFGGPLQRLASARRLVVPTEGHAVVQHLLLTDGPLLGPDRSGDFPLGGVLWWLILTAFSLVGFVLARSPKQRARIAAAMLPAITVGFSYLFLTGPQAPRFLIPVYGLLSVVVGAAVIWASRRRPAVRFCSAAIIISVLAWHLHVAVSLDRQQTHVRTESAQLARHVDSAAEGECFVVSQFGGPQIAYSARCGGAQLRIHDEALPPELFQAMDRGDDVFVLTVDRPAATELRDWPASELEVPSGWTLYRPPSQ